MSDHLNLNIRRVSLEEYAEAQYHCTSIENHIDKKYDDIVRSIDIAVSLEELAVVADNIQEATRDELNLIELGGNIAVAGTQSSPESVIPSLESYLGGKVSTEDFKLKEKLKKLWEMIHNAINTVWEKINDFFSNSNVMVAYALNDLRKLENLSREKESWKPKTTGFELDVSRFESIFNNGKEQVNDPKDIINLLETTNQLYKDLVDQYTANLLTLGSSLFDNLKNVKTDGSNIKSVITEVQKDLAAFQPRLFSSIARSIFNNPKVSPGRATSGKTSDAGLDTTTYKSGILGGLLMSVTVPESGIATGSFDIYVDRLKQCAVKVLPVGEVSSIRANTSVYTQEELKSIIKQTNEVLLTIKDLRDRKQNKIMELKKGLERASSELAKIDGDDATLSDIKSLMSLIAVFTNWVRTPLVSLVQHALRIERSISWLVKTNYSHYEEVNKPQQNNKK